MSMLLKIPFPIEAKNNNKKKKYIILTLYIVETKIRRGLAKLVSVGT